jgi:hypothetical protein
MGFPTLPIEIARGMLAKKTKGEAWIDTTRVVVVEDCRSFDEGTAESLAEDLLQLKDSFGGKVLPRNKGKDFESRACELVHRALQLSPACASSLEFWAWLTFIPARGVLADLVDWRFGARPPIDPVNYGIATQSTRFEGLYSRLWTRADLAFDEKAKDQYDLARRGDQDIWRSHLFREAYGRCGEVRRALIRFQYPDPKTGKARLTIEQIREVAKQLRIVNASLSYELLDEKNIADIISQIAAKVARRRK